MGPGLSANYDNVNFVFTSGVWKVHSAVSKKTGDRVCLWITDPDLLDRMIGSKAEQNTYLQSCLQGLQKSRKFIHPHILRIHEIQETLPQLAFSSEPVSSCITTLIGSLDAVDASYIGYQVLDALSAIHSGNQVHLGVSPSVVFLNELLDVKLFGFNWLTACDRGATVSTPFTSFFMDPSFPNASYTAPEVIVSHKCCAESDIFSFACLYFELLSAKPLRKVRNLSDYSATITSNFYTNRVPCEYYRFFEQAFQTSPQNRLDVQGMLGTDIFQSVQIKVLRYLDMIIAKDPKDKFGFFKGLANAISDFSPMLIKTKILPILVQECKNDKRFAPVLLGTIFQVAGKFSVSEFTNEIFREISFLTTVTDPPHIAIALLQSIGLIIDKTETNLHADTVYPIVFNALQSPNALVAKECVSKLKQVTDRMPERMIRSTLLPKIVELANKTTDAKVLSGCINSVTECLKKVDHDTFINESLMNLFESWKKHQQPEVSEAMLTLIESLNGSSENQFGKVVQVAAAITGSPGCPTYVQKRLCNRIISYTMNFKTAKNLNGQIEKPAYIPPPKPREVPKPAPSLAPADAPAYKPPQNETNPFASSAPSLAPSRTPRIVSSPSLAPAPAPATVPASSGLLSSPQQPFFPPPPQSQSQLPSSRPMRQVQPGGLTFPAPPQPPGAQSGTRDLLGLFRDSATEVMANVASGNAGSLYQMFRP